MPVVLRHKCGAILEVALEMAGRRGKCPTCGGVVAVPAEDALRQKMTEARAAHLHRQIEKIAPAPVPSAPKEVEADTEEEEEIRFADEEVSEPTEPPPQPGTRHCPYCNHVMTHDGIICVNCGTNTKTGQKLDTRIAPPADAPKGAPPKGRTSE